MHGSHSILSARSAAYVCFLIAVFAGQIFWILKIRRWGHRVFKNPILRTVLAALGFFAYVFALLYTFSHIWRSSSSTQFTVQALSAGATVNLGTVSVTVP